MMGFVLGLWFKGKEGGGRLGARERQVDDILC